MLRSHKITLNPNNKQRTYFAKACGVSRFAYNWALARWKERYETGEKVSESALRKELNSIKREQFPWMLEVTKCAPQLAIMDLGEAFNNFFKKKTKFPRFKKKGIRDSFELSNDQFKTDGKRLWIPNLGWVRMRESVRFAGKAMKATVSRRADTWFVSITVETDDIPKTSENQAEAKPHVVGVDVGINALATLSDGRSIAGVKAHKHLLPRLRRQSQALSRKVVRSNNHRKAARRLARTHYRISCLREDCLHKLTTDLVQNYGVIAIEDLNVSGMVKNRRLARSLMDSSFGELRRQVEYKAALCGRTVVVAPQFFASSKLCSACAVKNDELRLGARTWQCASCATVHQRDLNAAYNLRDYAVQYVADEKEHSIVRIETAGSSPVEACGEPSVATLCEAGR
ncbi:MAG: transposase [Candidatus Kapaibacterium sp.]|nr:MAG: transposase [Candidatus Kapabacteria bacterium]